jgi:PKD repeat protein
MVQHLPHRTLALLGVLAACHAAVETPDDDTASTAPTPPSAIEAGPAQVVPVGAPLTLSLDVDAEPTWDFGDGTQATGAEVTHTWSTPGNRVVTVSALFAGGVRRSDTVRVTVYVPPTDPRPVASAPLAIDDASGTAWVVEPDADVVVGVDLVEGTLRAALPTCEHPRSVAYADDRLWVACDRADAVWEWIEPLGAATPIVHPLAPGSRPFGVVRAGGATWVALEGARAFQSLQGAAPIPVPGEPRALAWSSDTGPIATTLRGPGALIGEGRRWPLADDPGPDSDTTNAGVVTGLHALAVAPDGSRIWAGGHVANVVRGLFVSGEALRPDLTLRATLRVIDPATGVEDVENRKVFDQQGEVSAIATTRLGTWLFAAHPGTGVLTRLDAFTLQTAGQALDGGVGVDGLATTADDTRLIAHSPLDHTLRIFAIEDPSRPPALIAEIALLDAEPLDPTLALGKRLFHDASDPRLAIDGYIACATCHPDGRDDGLTWDFTERGEGLRNTISLEGRGGVGMGRVHWTGNFDEIQDFEGDIRSGQGGTGLLSDAAWAAHAEPLGAAKAGLSAELDALAAYVASIPLPTPPPPTTDASNLFATSGCAACHIPALGFTDSQLLEPLRHDVGTLDAAAGLRLGGPLDGFDTPTLLGVWATGPYLHDGRAETLEAAIEAHRTEAPLAADAVRDLAAWLRGL